MDVSDRRMQVQLTQEAKIASDFLYIRAIFAVVGFVSALSGLAHTRKAARFASEEEFAKFVDCAIDKLRKIEYNTK